MTHEYENACEFQDKADYEGGLAEMALGYGISEGQVPYEVFITARMLENSYNRFKREVGRWHERSCQRENCPWASS